MNKFIEQFKQSASNVMNEHGGAIETIVKTGVVMTAIMGVIGLQALDGETSMTGLQYAFEVAKTGALGTAGLAATYATFNGINDACYKLTDAIKETYPALRESIVKAIDWNSERFALSGAFVAASTVLGTITGALTGQYAGTTAEGAIIGAKVGAAGSSIVSGALWGYGLIGDTFSAMRERASNTQSYRP